MVVDFSKKEQIQRYKLMSQTVIPRPIAWAVTKGLNGVINVAPFSYFTALSSNPPVLIVSVGHKKDKSPKDTLKNIRESGKCTICVPSLNQLEKMHLSSKELGSDESEAEIFDIDLDEVLKEYPPMIKDSPVAFFCDLYREIELDGSKTVPLLLEIKYQYLKEDIVKDKDNLYIEFSPIARVGKKYYMLGEELEAPVIK